MADDAILEMTGTASWFSGKATCVPFIAAQAIGQSGDWRMLPLHANGQLAVAAYHLGDDDTYHPFAIVVLATTLTHLTRISLFVEPTLFEPLRPAPGHSAGLGDGHQSVQPGKSRAKYRATSPGRMYGSPGRYKVSSRPHSRNPILEIELHSRVVHVLRLQPEAARRRLAAGPLGEGIDKRPPRTPATEGDET